MSHALVKVYVHYVWTTKNRERLLLGDARNLMNEHIRKNAQEKKICIEDVDVQPEHVHAFVKLASDQPIEEIVKLMKGESSYWINQNDVLAGKFSWQTGYAAFSVDYEGVDAVKRYIRNQDEHHRRKTYVEEVETMLRVAGFSDYDIAQMLNVGNR